MIAPPCPEGFNQSVIEISLNDQQYSDNNVIYRYYRRPTLYYITPREGPIKGGTVVTAVGQNFRDTKEITCKFGDQKVPGVFKSQREIECIAPQTDKPMSVPFSISLSMDMYSPSVPYLYYDEPQVLGIGPSCGPDYELTQITVFGKNFIDMGTNKAFCVFNKTTFTNATVFSDDIIKCDSPSFIDKFGHTLLKTGNEFYMLEITVDGGLNIQGTAQKFMYYRDPDVLAINPPRGPLSGHTQIKISGAGFNQEGACNKTVRFATMELKSDNETSDDAIYVTAPGAPLVRQAGQVVVAIALNGQQFTHDKILHIRDDENTYEYYENPIISNMGPIRGANVGGTKVRVNGIGFTPLLDKEGNTDRVKNKMWVRFVDPDTLQEIAPAT